MRFLFDTNVVIRAGLVAGEDAADSVAAYRALSGDNDHEVGVCAQVLAETLCCLTRNRSKDGQTRPPILDFPTAKRVLDDLRGPVFAFDDGRETEVWERWWRLIDQDGFQLCGKGAYDARIFAAAVVYGYDYLVTNDGDFTRFQGVTRVQIVKPADVHALL